MDDESESDEAAKKNEPGSDESTEQAQDHNSSEGKASSTAEQKRKAGKQQGAQGYGRTQKLEVTCEESHAPHSCVVCGQGIDSSVHKAWTAFYVIDVEQKKPDGRPGITFSNVKHMFYEATCKCGHHKDRTSWHLKMGGLRPK